MAQRRLSDEGKTLKVHAGFAAVIIRINGQFAREFLVEEFGILASLAGKPLLFHKKCFKPSAICKAGLNKPEPLVQIQA